MLLLAWKLDDKPVLLVGAGEVAETRVVKLLDAKCDLTVVAPEPTETIQALHNSGKLRLIVRKYDPEDLELRHWAMVLTAINDRQASIDIAAECRRRRIPVNAADIPDACDFYFGANIDRGPLKMLISTSGAAPAIAKKMRKTIESTLDTATVTAAVDNVSRLKKEVRAKLPEMDPETVKIRMGVVTAYCEKHSWQELARMDDAEISRVVSSAGSHKHKQKLKEEMRYADSGSLNLDDIAEEMKRVG